MRSIWEFLANSDNRALLGWIGGGLATLAGGLWVVLKYFLDRKKVEPKKSEPNLTVSVAHGVGIGGNAQVRIRSLRVGLGLQALFWLGLVVLLLSVVGGRAWDVFLPGTARMPSFALEFDCLPDPSGLVHRLKKEEADQFDRLRDFSEKYDGSVVYLGLLINSDCAACGCSRVGSIDAKKKGRYVNPPDGTPAIYIDSTPVSERKEMLADVEKHGHELLVFIPDKWAKFASFYVPSYSQIPENGVYRRGTYGSMLAYDGPFVVHFEDGTGYQDIYFEPLREPPSVVRSEVECLRQRDQLSFVQRVVRNCF